MKVKSESEVAQSCLTLCDPMDCSPPGPSIHGIFQARVLEWGAIAFSGQLAYSQIKEPFVTYQNHRLSDEISIWEKIETAFGATFHFIFSRRENGEGNGTPLQYFCLENPMDGGAWWAAVHGVAKSQT